MAAGEVAEVLEEGGEEGVACGGVGADERLEGCGEVVDYEEGRSLGGRV